MNLRPVPRRGALAFAAGALAAVSFSGAPRAAPDAIELHAASVPLDARDPAVSSIGALDWRGGLELGSPDRRFGGWSDLWVSADNGRLVAISDNGWFLDAALEFDGALRGVTRPRLGRLLRPGGDPVVERDADAEGLVRMPDGGFAVSFERTHRIHVYPPSEPPFARAPRLVALPASMRDAPRNGGVEALALMADGRFLALTEEVDAGDGALACFVGGAGGWGSLAYVPAAGFRPVGACVLPGGDTLVLERSFGLIGGFGTRLARVAAGTWREGARVGGTELARLRAPLVSDNFEGICTTRAADGRDLVWLVSDDNYSFLQRTYLAVFALK